MLAGQSDAMAELETTIPSTCDATWCPRWTPHCLSPPAADREPSGEENASGYSYATDTVSVESVANHFNGMDLGENLALPNYSDCVICGNRSAMKLSTTTWTRRWSWARRLQNRRPDKEPLKTECQRGHSFLCQERWQLV